MAVVNLVGAHTAVQDFTSILINVTEFSEVGYNAFGISPLCRLSGTSVATCSFILTPKWSRLDQRMAVCKASLNHGEAAMPDEAEALATRATTMANKLEIDRKSYLCNARWNYSGAQLITIAAAAAGAAAALLGLIPSGTIQKWEVGVVAAISPALIVVGKQLGFQQKANWHYRKVDRIRTLQRRLAYELPVLPSADNLKKRSPSRSRSLLRCPG